MTLAPALESEVVGSAPTVVEYVKGETDSYYLILNSDGSLAKYQDVSPFTASSAVAVNTSDGGDALSMSSSGDAVWLANGLNIEVWAAIDTDSIVSYTHASDGFTHVWALKGRLWATDASGNFYNAPPGVHLYLRATGSADPTPTASIRLRAMLCWRASASTMREARRSDRAAL